MISATSLLICLLFAHHVQVEVEVTQGFVAAFVLSILNGWIEGVKNTTDKDSAQTILMLGWLMVALPWGTVILVDGITLLSPLTILWFGVVAVNPTVRVTFSKLTPQQGV